KNAARANTVVEEVSSTSSDKHQRLIRKYFDKVFSEDELEESERLLIQFQADNCLPDRCVEKLSTLRIFIFLNKACARAIPKRKQLTRILDKYSNVEEEGQLLALSNRLEFSGNGCSHCCHRFSTNDTSPKLSKSLRNPREIVVIAVKYGKLK
ncbi:hypothetical protein F442_12652, partial [Phytophthora nicotianae P10297]